MDLGLDIPSVYLIWGFQFLEYRHCRDLYKGERKERGLGGKEERTLWARDHEYMRAAMDCLCSQTPWKLLDKVG